MRILISLCSLMLAGAMASGINSGYSGGSGYGPNGAPHGNSYHSFNYRELAQLEKMIHAVGVEKLALGKKVDMLKNQKIALLDKIDQIQNVTIPQFQSVQDSQDESLRDIRKELKELSHDIYDEVAALAGEYAVSQRQESQVNGLWARIYKLVAYNNEQAALLAKSKRFLDESKEKLNEKLIANEERGEGRITELKYNTKALGELVNTRRCYTVNVHVTVDDKETFTGTVSEPIDPGFFGGLTPTAYCAINGFHSSINLDRSHGGYGGYGYGGYNNYYSDLYQNLAMTVDCKPFNDRVEVTVFDQSKGANNDVQLAYVAVKLCTFGPQASDGHPSI